MKKTISSYSPKYLKWVLTALISCMFLFVSIFLMNVMAEETVVESWETGDCTATLYSNGKMVIEGEGRTGYYYPENIPDPVYPPWYSYADQINSVEVKEGVTTLSGYAFYRCTSIKDVSLPDSLTEIGAEAFNRCKNLKSINIPSSLKRVNYGCFENCSSLEELLLPESVNEIGSYAFSGCLSLKSINIPTGVTVIDIHVFSGCRSLKSISLPDTITAIDYGAFRGCSSLKRISLPDAITMINQEAFYGCKSLENIVLPNGVTEIGDDAFIFCENLKSVVIPSGVSRIPIGAFHGCKSLKQISLPDSITEIGDQAFSHINDVFIDSNADQIEMDSYAFYFCRPYSVKCHVKCDQVDRFVSKYPSDYFVTSSSEDAYTDPIPAYVSFVPEHDYDMDGVCSICGELDPYAYKLVSSKGNDLIGKTFTDLELLNAPGEDYLYKFIVWNTTTNQWYILQDYSDQTSIRWYTGPEGIKNLYVDVKNKNDESDIKRAELNNVTVSTSSLAVSEFTSSAGLILPAKDHTTLTAFAEKGTAPYEFRFIVHNEDNDQWYKIQDFSVESTCNWFTGPTGKKTLYVDVRDADGIVVRCALENIVVS